MHAAVLQIDAGPVTAARCGKRHSAMHLVKMDVLLPFVYCNGAFVNKRMIGRLLPTAIRLVNCSIGTNDEVIAKLEKIPLVVYVYKLIGYHDIVVKVESNSEEELRKTISNKIRTLDHILSTITMIVFEK